MARREVLAALRVEHAALARDDHAVAAPGEGPADEALALAEAVQICGVEEIDADVECGGKGIQRLRLVRWPVSHCAVLVAADAPRAEADLGDGEARAPQLPLTHPSSGPRAR